MIQCGIPCSTACPQHSARRAAFTAAARLPRCHRAIVRAGEEGSSSPPPPAPAPAPEQKYQRTFKSLGSQVIEQNTDFEEPPAKDMWEGESYAAVGEVMEKWFLPFLVVLGLVCGGYAANTYNEDADVFIKPSSGPDQLPTVVPASKLQPAPTLDQ